ncbi:MAG: hypothetical protein WA941_03330 [Nitrososphaeraceae archaeon]
MNKGFQLIGIGVSFVAVVALVVGLSQEAIAQNVTGNTTEMGLGVPLNASEAESSPEAMFGEVGPENVTVITPQLDEAIK